MYLSAKIKKLTAFIALSAYLIVGIGADVAFANCFEQNGDLNFEKAMHGISMQEHQIDATNSIQLFDGGNSTSVEVSEKLHRDERITPEGNTTLIFSWYLPPNFKIMLYTVADHLSGPAKLIYVKPPLAISLLNYNILNIKETTVLLI